MASKAKRIVITDSFVIVPVKGKKIPFTGPVQVKHAEAVLACKGKTVADAKKKGADAWTVRKLVELKVITVKAPAVKAAA